MAASFETTQLAGKTLRFTVSNLVDVDGDEVTTGGNVTINLYTEHDELSVTGTVAPDDADANTYHAEITLPAVTRKRRFVVKAAASKNSRVYRDLGVVWIEPF
jgi:hypothetical protein